MNCKHCKKQIKKDDPKMRVGLSYVHDYCLKDFIAKTLKKTKLKKVKTDWNKIEYENIKSGVKKTTWNTFSVYIRLKYSRDGICTCISCGKKMTAISINCHAGHFIPKSNSEYFYFNEDNIRPQCAKCNCHGSQDTGANFERNLRCEIGDEKVDLLILKSKQKETLQRTTNDYKKIGKKYRLKIKEMKQLN